MCNSDKRQAGAEIEVTPEKAEKPKKGKNDARVCPTNHVIHRCDPAHVILCTGVKNGYRVWEKIAVLDLPHYLARLDDLEGIIVDDVAITAF